MGGTRGPGDLRLGLRANRADHGGPQRRAPLAEEAAHATGRRVNQQDLACLHAVDAAQQHLRGEALEQDGRGLGVRERGGQGDGLDRGEEADPGVRAVLGRDVAHAVTHRHAGHALAQRLHDAHPLNPRDARQGEGLIEAAADVDVVEVDAHGGLAQAQLARAGLGHGDVLKAQHVGGAGGSQDDGTRHGRVSSWPMAAESGRG